MHGAVAASCNPTARLQLFCGHRAGTETRVECQHVVHPPSFEAGGFLPRAECGRKNYNDASIAADTLFFSKSGNTFLRMPTLALLF